MFRFLREHTEHEEQQEQQDRRRHKKRFQIVRLCEYVKGWCFFVCVYF